MVFPNMGLSPLESIWNTRGTDKTSNHSPEANFFSDGIKGWQNVEIVPTLTIFFSALGRTNPP